MNKVDKVIVFRRLTFYLGEIERKKNNSVKKSMTRIISEREKGKKEGLWKQEYL